MRVVRIFLGRGVGLILWPTIPRIGLPVGSVAKHLFHRFFRCQREAGAPSFVPGFAETFGEELGLENSVHGL